MKVTIKDVAEKAEVSIATVSHVINKTRYVRQELVEKVKKSIEETGYIVKDVDMEGDLRIGKESMVALIVPNIGGTVYSQLITTLSSCLSEKGYLLSVHLSEDDKNREKHILTSVMSDKRIAAIIFAPVSSEAKSYRKLISGSIPFLCLERTMKNSPVSSILSENVSGIYAGTKHLIKSGHEKIALLLEDRNLTTAQERLEGYQNALEDSKIKYNENLLIKVNLYLPGECGKKIKEFYENSKPTAFIAGGNRLTLTLLKGLQDMGLECPKDISVVGFGDDKWCELAEPPLTTIKQNTEEMGKQAAEKIISMIQGSMEKVLEIRIPTTLSIRKSTQMIGRGPFGEKAIAPEELTLTETEISELKVQDFKVGISFHYGGTAWARLHENGIRDTLEKYGITVVSVTDAHFDPQLQVTQLEGLRMQKSDAIIAIPADDEVTAQKFKELASETKLIFISNVPDGMKKYEYASCVSVNERENGHNAGILLGEHFKNKKGIKIGIIAHGAPFYGTHLRDMVAEQTLLENYPNLEIVETNYFHQIEHAYEVCKSMMLSHPDIQGIYVSWDRPALEVIRALKEIGRTDTAIVTFDLDIEIASYLAKESMVIGMSTQRPYEQGIAVALATVKALLNKHGFKYIGVHPYSVQKKNLLRAWRDILHEKAPSTLEANMTK